MAFAFRRGRCARCDDWCVYLIYRLCGACLDDDLRAAPMDHDWIHNARENGHRVSATVQGRMVFVDGTPVIAVDQISLHPEPKRRS